MKISACLIVKNEEKNIARCIQSFKHTVDEIVIVDTGSSDKTVEIAKKMGATVYYFKWDNNFANARNYAVKKAKGDWILFLDADEYFHGGTGNNLRGVLQTVKHSTDALLCKCFDVSENGQVFYSDNRTRIFRNDSKIRFKGRIHEVLHKAGEKLLMEVVPEKYLQIYHTGYLSEELLEQKHRRNLKILLTELKHEESNPMVHSYLMNTYLGLGDFEQAIKHGRLFLDSRYSAGRDAEVRYTLIRAMISGGKNREEIVSETKSALELYPGYPDLHWLLAKFLLAEGEYSNALISFRKAIESGFSYSGIEGTVWPSYLAEAYYNIGVIFEMQNELENAVDYFSKSLIQDKFNAEKLVKLINLTRTEGNDVTGNVLKNIYNDKNREEIRFLIAVLGKLRVKSVLKRYYNLWRRNFGQEDITLLFVHLTEGKYEEAFKYFLEIYTNQKKDSMAVLAATAALLSDSDVCVEKIRSVADAPLRRLLNCYCGEAGNTCLDEKEFIYFMGILNEFIYLGVEEHIGNMLKLSNLFSADKSFIISELFFKMGKYKRTLELLQSIPEGDFSGLAQLYFKIGLCYYKSFDYQKAVESFEKALRHGYAGNDIFEYLRWTNDKITCDIK